MRSFFESLRMPPFLKLLFFVEMWERFSYYGMRALLVLFLTSSLGFSDPKAYAVYSLFAALGYAGPVMGGLLADRLMGFRNMVILGGSIMALGHAMLALVRFDPFLLYLGLGFIAVGTGLFKGNISNLLGSCYEQGDPERDRGFTLFYVSVNLGSLLSSLSCGYVAYRYGWDFGFGLAGVGMLLGLLVFLRFGAILGNKGFAPKPDRLRSKPIPGVSAHALVVFACLLAAACAAYLLQASELFAQLLSFFGLAIMAWMAFIVYGCTIQERKNLAILFILMFFFTCFFALEMQLGSLISLFTERNVDKAMFGFNVPATVSQAINPFSIIVFGPLLSQVFMRLGHRWAMLRYGLGLLTMVLCFFLLYASGFQVNARGEVPYYYLFVSIVFMGIGELCIAPLIQSYCTILAPERIRGLMMGVLLLSVSYSNLAGLLISKFMSIPKAAEGANLDPFASLAIYQAGFYKIMLFNIALVGVFALLYPFLNRICRQQMGEELPEPSLAAGYKHVVDEQPQ